MAAGPGDRPEATFVALAGDEVVGWSKFSLGDAQPSTLRTTTSPASSAPGEASAVSLALSKQAQIAWAKRGGVRTAARRATRSGNAPIRKLNAEFGYEPSGTRILFRGPLAPTQR